MYGPRRKSEGRTVGGLTTKLDHKNIFQIFFGRFLFKRIRRPAANFGIAKKNYGAINEAIPIADF